MSHPLITADQLSVSIDGSAILQALSFQLEAGSLTGIIGPNGSGKTTLLRTISGILDFEGDLTFQGTSIAAWDKKLLALELAVLPQHTQINFDFTVQDYVMLGRTPHKGWLEGENAKDRMVVNQVLQDLDLQGFAHRTLPSLSGGERQRVVLAQALVQQTSVLLLDEPTSHLDIYHQFDLLKRIRRSVHAGKTIVVVFHDLSIATRFTDALLVLNNGRLVAQGKTSEVLNEQLIKDVFRMEATVHMSSDNLSYIQFLDQS